eukprot:2244164-Pyramimonas_sp.AAC.1
MVSGAPWGARWRGTGTPQQEGEYLLFPSDLSVAKLSRQRCRLASPSLRIDDGPLPSTRTPRTNQLD